MICTLDAKRNCHKNTSLGDSLSCAVHGICQVVGTSNMLQCALLLLLHAVLSLFIHSLLAHS